VNFLGGARSAGAHARYSSLDRGVRVDFTQPYFFRPHFSLNAEGSSGTPSRRRTTRSSPAASDDDAPRNRADVVVVSITNEHDSSSIAPSCLNDPTLRNDLIALGLDPRTGEAERHAEFARIRSASDDGRQPVERASRLSDRVSRRRGGPTASRHVQLLRVSLDGRHYLPFGEKVVLASRAQLGNIRPVGLDQVNIPFSKKYFLGGATSIRGWGRYEVSPLSAGVPIGGDSMFALQRGNPRGAARQARASCCFSMPATCGRSRAVSTQRSAVRRRARASLSDADRAVPLRLRLSAEPDPGLLVNGQPRLRAGACTSASARPT
jgi:outer membrane protein assembly factor BamA